jgi:hypothetical protein
VPAKATNKQAAVITPKITAQMNQPVADVEGSLAPLSKIPAISPTAGNVNGKKIAAPILPKN